MAQKVTFVRLKEHFEAAGALIRPAIQFPNRVELRVSVDASRPLNIYYHFLLLASFIGKVTSGSINGAIAFRNGTRIALCNELLIVKTHLNAWAILHSMHSD